jgi:hypothetical protein
MAKTKSVGTTLEPDGKPNGKPIIKVKAIVAAVTAAKYASTALGSEKGIAIEELLMTPNVEVTGAARLYRAASVWTAGLGLFAVLPAPTFWK